MSLSNTETADDITETNTRMLYNGLLFKYVMASDVSDFDALTHLVFHAVVIATRLCKLNPSHIPQLVMPSLYS